MLEMFSPRPVTSMSSRAMPETRFITGAHRFAPSAECDLTMRPITMGISMVTMSDLAISPAFTSTPGSSSGRTSGT